MKPTESHQRMRSYNRVCRRVEMVPPRPQFFCTLFGDVYSVLSIDTFVEFSLSVWPQSGAEMGDPYERCFVHVLQEFEHDFVR